MSEELPPPFSTPMPEDRRGRLELFKERATAFEKLVNKRQAAAEARGRQLLLSLLDEHQRQDLEENGGFQITGSEGGLFLVTIQGMSGNVFLMETPTVPFRSEAVVSFCAHFQPQVDEFLYPYIRTLQPHGVSWHCQECCGSYENWLFGLSKSDLDRQWPEHQVQQRAMRYLCQSDLMIAQMLKIQVDEVGWVDVAVPHPRHEAGGEYLKKINEIRVQRQTEALVSSKVAEFGIDGTIAAGPLTIRVRDPYWGGTTTRYVRVTETGGWEFVDRDVVTAARYARVAPGPWDRARPGELRLNFENADLGEAARAIEAMGEQLQRVAERQIQVQLTEDQLRLMHRLTGGL